MGVWQRFRELLRGKPEARTYPSGLELAEFFSLGANTTAGVAVTEFNALTYSAVFAAVRVLSETVGSLPLHLYERIEPRGKRRASGHQLYTILHDAPNPEMTSLQFRETMQGHLVTWGNAYAQKVTDRGGNVVQLWPLRPDLMQVRRSGDVLVYEYARPDGGMRLFSRDEIFHIAGLGYDGVMGYSPIAYARQAIGLGLATEQFGGSYFGQGATPSGVLEHPQVLNDEAYARLKRFLDEQMSGMSNARRPAILEEGMKWTQIGIPPEDSQFLQTREFQIEEIARIFRIPPHMLGDLSRSTFSNIEHQSIEFVVHTIRPWLVRWEQAIAQQLLAPEERGRFFAEFLVDGLLRGDTQSRYAAYATARQWGWMSANDVRELENQNPVDGGDEYLVPLNMVPAGASREPAQQARSQGRDETRATRSLAARRRLRNAYRPILDEAARRIVRREVQDIRREARKLLRRRQMVDWDEFLERYYEQHRAVVERDMAIPLSSYAEAIIAEAGDEIGEAAIADEALQRFIKDYESTLSVRWISSSRGQLRDVVAQAEAVGEDPLLAVEHRLDEWDEKRPSKVGERESVQAGEAFAKATWIAAGVTTLRWQTFGETCPYCESLSGVEASTDSFFINPGEPLQPEGVSEPLITRSGIGHPPAHVGCDCSVVPAVLGRNPPTQEVKAAMYRNLMSQMTWEVD